MHKLMALLLLPLLLSGCSDDRTASEQQIELNQPEQEALVMPLKMPITDVAVRNSNAVSDEDDPLDNIKALEWDELMPKDYRIEALLEQINAGDLSDDDPRIDEAMEKIKEMYSKAPVVEELDNTDVKLPGFVVPMNLDGKETTDFLLVPYYGACIHVPPPPPNQTVFVTGHKSELKLYDTVWVIGRLRVERSENELGDSGYSIIATDIRPYE